MDKDSAQNIMFCSFSLRKGRESNSSLTQECVASAKDGKTKSIKRKAIPEKMTPRKRTRVSEPKPQNTSVRVRQLERKVREDGEEEPSNHQKKKARISPLLVLLDRNQLDKESASSSVDSGRETGSTTSVEDVSESSRKRKASADREGASRKKKRSLDLKESISLSIDVQRAKFEAKYEQGNQLGEGGCGSVFAGYRKADNLPVAIKHIPEDKVLCKHVDKNGKELSVEVAVMLKLAAGTTGSVGTSAPVSLLDWYDLGEELILVLERPVPSEDLFSYIEVNGGSLQEEEAKVILKQLVDAAKELQDKHIFHRDIKVENILIETGSNVPRVRLIDFGLSCFNKKGSSYPIFFGTAAHIPPEWYSQYTYRAGPTTVWQMGVVLFETLHRETQFETTEFLKNELKISNNLSEICQDFLQMCLTKAPERRPTLKQLQRHPWLQ